MIIGLTGTMGAGKGTVAEFLKRKGFEVHSYSDVLREEAKRMGVSTSRTSLQDIGNIIRNEKKDYGYLSSKIIKNIKTEHAIADGVRNPEEILRLKKENAIIIGIDAPQNMRYERIVRRKRKGDPLSFDDFKRLDEKENKGMSYGQNIMECLKMADYLIINDGTIEELYKKVYNIMLELGVK